ncbi:MAG: hypothetical protein JO076_01315 [Verrucomicrobia bacterium]|nr:hypothetical protein [Verrucomicrobiota bacterium]
MPPERAYRKIRVFIACPGDVEDEKARLLKVIESLRFDADAHGFFLDPIEWRQCVPDLGLPQEVIFEQVKPEAWDIFIAILWTRFGTPCGVFDVETGRELTGTEAEIVRAIEIHRAHDLPRVFIYRSTRPPNSLRELRGDQLKAVDDFLQECERGGRHPALVKLYEQPDEFERFVSEHLRKTLATVDLTEIKSKQDWQQDHLKVVQLVLPLLLPIQEQQHLINLGIQNTSGYRGNDAVRSELRRLRSMGLIEKRAGRNIGEIKDNHTIDLQDYVYLTKSGQEWVTIIQANQQSLSRDREAQMPGG